MHNFQQYTTQKNGSDKLFVLSYENEVREHLKQQFRQSMLLAGPSCLWA